VRVALGSLASDGVGRSYAARAMRRSLEGSVQRPLSTGSSPERQRGPQRRCGVLHHGSGFPNFENVTTDLGALAPTTTDER